MKFGTKIFIYIFLSTAFIICGMSLMTGLWITRHHLKTTIKHEKELSRIISLKAGDYILRNESLQLYKLYRSIIESEPYIEYVFSEKKNEMLVHTFAEGVPKRLLTLGDFNDASRVHLTPLEDEKGHLIYHLRVKIGDPAYAMLHVGVSDQKIRTELVPLRNLIFIIGGLLLLTVPFGVAFLLSRLLAKPLYVLSNGVKHLGAGELHYRVDVKTGDEIEQLAHHVNSMAERLEEMRDGLKSEIDEREQAEKEISRQHNFLINVINSLTMPFYVIDARTYKILLANSVASGNAGLPEAITCYQLTHQRETPCEGEEHICPLQQVLKTREYSYVEHVHYDSGGNQRIHEIHAYPLFGDDGNVAQIIEYSVDVTDHKRAENERIKLEQQVQRTQKLESLGVLAGGIAHDFNNILMAILGNADLAQMDISPASPAYSRVADIIIAARRAADLCNQMLAYSGKGRFVVEALNVSEIVKEISRMIEVSISKKAILKYRFTDNLPSIKADATQIRQIVLNLITNASEALGDNSGIISVSTGAIECDQAYLAGNPLDDKLPPGVYTYIEVSDTGCGMDQETKQKLFDPFFTTKFTGRGLGLSAVLGIVRGHKGVIKVYSELGKGSTIRALFPAVEETAPSVCEKLKTDIGQWRGSGTILLVDDEESVRSVGKRMLEKNGFHILLAAHGKEAVEIYQKHADEIVCVILDLTMPYLDGEQTFNELLKIKKDVRVLMSSGYNEQELREQLAGRGLAGFIQKPYQTKMLLEKVRNVIEAGF